MSTRRHAGMTLVELIMAIVIISIGVAGMMAAYSHAVKISADPMRFKQMSAVAEGLMEEITLKPFIAAANSAPASHARDTYNDVRDYNGYASTGVYDIDGSAVAGLENYDVSISVTNTAINSIAASDALTITITVGIHGSSDSYVLQGWRTCYGGGAC